LTIAKSSEIEGYFYAFTTFNSKETSIPPNMTEQLILKGTLEGHSGWVTSLATSMEK
jgi:hypothetical protein